MILKMSQELEKLLIFITEVLFVGGMSYGSQVLRAANIDRWAAGVARYTVYLLLSRGSRAALTVACRRLRGEPPRWTDLVVRYKPYGVVFALACCVAVLVPGGCAATVPEECLFVVAAALVVRYLDMNHHDSITYGVGMACSFMEGYLDLVLTSDGAERVGLDENIRRYEARHGVRFPVRRLMLVVTKSLYCPPDLKEFNRSDPTLTYMEAGDPLGEVERDVAGVKRRVYRNSVYKLHGGRGGGGVARPVYVAAECATPLHTLHRVLQKRAVYDDLLKCIDPTQVAEEFCAALRSVVARSPACRGRCELVFFDDTDPTQNLADVLLEAIRRIEPNFENL